MTPPAAVRFPVAARVPVAQPGRIARATAGVVAAAVAVGVGHLMASLTHPPASPLVAVGSALVDAAPTPAKEFAVRTLGTNDKPVLLSAIALVLVLLAAGIGLVAWRRPRTALGGIALIGLAGVVAVFLRAGAGPVDALPSILAALAGMAALRLMTGRQRVRSSHRSPEPAAAMAVAQTGRSRRTFLTALGGGAVVAAVAGAGGVAVGRVRSGAGRLARIVLPTPHSPAPALPAGVQVDGATPFLTPTDQFYRVDISLVTPHYAAEDWSLTIDGMVDRPLTLTYAELLAMPMIERTITLTCVSNEVGGSYVSTATWLGVPLRDIFARVGVRAGVDQIFSYSMDSGYTASTPYQAVTDGRDAMIAVGMNGAVLPDKNGFPARMLVPGLFGFVSGTKWLQRLELTTYARREAYWTKRGWATDAPILVQSRIDVPKSLGTLPKDKPVLAGVAWAQHRGIAKVEVRIDGGPWRPAKLAADAGIDLWRQWTYVYNGAPGQHSAEVRATDRNGEVQPEQRTKVFPDGARGWHQILFTAA